jgi:aminopeptidase N
MWFFDQWFMKPGHPELLVTQRYNKGQLQLRVQQLQDTTYTPVYRLPLQVAVWAEGKKQLYPVVVDKADQTLTFDVAAAPQLVLFDAEQQLLGVVEHEKTEDELLFQFRNAGHLAPKLDALYELQEQAGRSQVQGIYKEALQEGHWALRSTALGILSRLKEGQVASLEPIVRQLAVEDKKSSVRAEAILALAGWNSSKYQSLIRQAVNDSSYQVSAAAILAYAGSGAGDAKQLMQQFEQEDNEDVVLALATIYAVQAGPEKYDWFMQKLKGASGGGLYYLLQSLGAYLASNGETNTPEMISLLGDIAMNNRLYYVRAAAYQTLMVMSEKPEVEALMQQIKAKEKDDRLLQLYGM